MNPIVGVDIDWDDELFGDHTERNIAEIANEFESLSQIYGKIIISEHLSGSNPTFAKYDKGVAGGIKYKVGNIFFKFAVDVKVIRDGKKSYLYGNTNPYDIGAMKAASNEIKGLMGCINCNVEALYFPLMCTIDYCGYRLIAMSKLKIQCNDDGEIVGNVGSFADRSIGTSTLKYGAAAVNGPVFTDPEFEKKAKEIAQRLYLRKHPVNSYQADGDNHSVDIYLARDVEGHLIGDRKYFIDFSRIFPPEEFLAGRDMEVFYNLFRPEFLQIRKQPLSCDGFSTFSYPGEETESTKLEIHKATEYLRGDLCDKFAQDLIFILQNSGDTFSYSVTQLIHSNGINCRHLGRIIAQLKSNIELQINCRNLSKQEYLHNAMIAKKLIYSEIIARSLKIICKFYQRHLPLSNYNSIPEIIFPMLKHLFTKREDQTNNIRFHNRVIISMGPNASPMGDLLHSFFTIHNIIYTNHNNHNNAGTNHRNNNNHHDDKRGKLIHPKILFSHPDFWKSLLKKFVGHFFIRTFDRDEVKSNDLDVRDLIDTKATVKRVCDLCGIKLRNNLLEEFDNNNDSFHLLIFDIKKLTVRVRRSINIDTESIQLFFKDLKKQIVHFDEKWDNLHETIRTTNDRAINNDFDQKKKFLDFHISAYLYEVSSKFKFLKFFSNMGPGKIHQIQSDNECFTKRIGHCLHSAVKVLNNFKSYFTSNDTNPNDTEMSSLFHFYKAKLYIEWGLLFFMKYIIYEENCYFKKQNPVSDTSNSYFISALMYWKDSFTYFTTAFKHAAVASPFSPECSLSSSAESIVFICSFDHLYKSMCQDADRNAMKAFHCNKKISCMNHKVKLLRAFFLQYFAVKARNECGDGIYFAKSKANYLSPLFTSIEYLFEYLNRDGPDPLYYFSGLAGSVLENALHQFPSISSKPPTDDDGYNNLEENSYNFYLSSDFMKPEHLWHDQSLPRTVYLHDFKTKLKKPITITSDDCLLHFIPVLDDQIDLFYKKSQVKNSSTTIIGEFFTILSPIFNVPKAMDPRMPIIVQLSNESSFVIDHIIMDCSRVTSITFEFYENFPLDSHCNKINCEQKEKVYLNPDDDGKIRKRKFFSQDKPCK